ncbi:GTP-binding nuclear protein Ran-2 [Drosophila sechellia]|uniref:GM18226 n=1 Tax=Drosophila sechellia TaxID=7238 RepID=B4I2K8_DROSE|nr:GTP-binding nuclear protein Ran-2 [Drosophila sechellia]EDW54003.1 GM18226 [Drosophila sechellia]
MIEYKLVILGDAQVGKTSLMNRVLYEMFEEEYKPTIGVDVNSFTIQTNRGFIRFIVWDTAGQEELCGLRDGYYINAQCAIIMVDEASHRTYRAWHLDLVRVCKNIPVVICGNKSENQKERTSALQVTFGRMNLVYYGISVKFKMNLEMPFMYLARKLTGDRSLTLVRPPEHNFLEVLEETPPEEELEREDL